MPSLARPESIHLGLDVHKDTISVGILGAGDDVPVLEKIFHDGESVRRLVGRFADPGLVGAGPLRGGAYRV